MRTFDSFRFFKLLLFSGRSIVLGPIYGACLVLSVATTGNLFGEANGLIALTVLLASGAFLGTLGQALSAYRRPEVYTLPGVRSHLAFTRLIGAATIGCVAIALFAPDFPARGGGQWLPVARIANTALASYNFALIGFAGTALLQPSRAILAVAELMLLTFVVSPRFGNDPTAIALASAACLLALGLEHRLMRSLDSHRDALTGPAWLRRVRWDHVVCAGSLLVQAVLSGWARRRGHGTGRLELFLAIARPQAVYVLPLLLFTVLSGAAPGEAEGKGHDRMALEMAFLLMTALLFADAPAHSLLYRLPRPLRWRLVLGRWLRNIFVLPALGVLRVIALGVPEYAYGNGLFLLGAGLTCLAILMMIMELHTYGSRLLHGVISSAYGSTVSITGGIACVLVAFGLKELPPAHVAAVLLTLLATLPTGFFVARRYFMRGDL